MTAQLLAPPAVQVGLVVHKTAAKRRTPAGFEATASVEDLAGVGTDTDQAVAEALAVKALRAAYAVKYPSVPDTLVTVKTLYVDFSA